MAKIKPRVKVPKKAKAGEAVTIKTLISHPMESGQRKDKKGNIIPRKIINKFVATFNGEEAFSATIEPASWPAACRVARSFPSEKVTGPAALK